jgi:hypothetical protein
MTQSIAENVNRDMYIGDDGNVAFVTAIDATAQLCKSRIESQQGEMMYNASGGMPTRATAWDQFNPKQFVAAARSIMLATPDVTSVPEFDLQVQNNALNYDATIDTDYGTTTVSTS